MIGLVWLIGCFDCTKGYGGEGPWYRLMGPVGCPTFTILMDWHGVCDRLTPAQLFELFSSEPAGSNLDWLICSYGGHRRMMHARGVLDLAGLDWVPVVRVLRRTGDGTGSSRVTPYGWEYDGGKDQMLASWAPDSVASVLVDDRAANVEACLRRGCDVVHAVRSSARELDDALGLWHHRRREEWAAWGLWHHRRGGGAVPPGLGTMNPYGGEGPAEEEFKVASANVSSLAGSADLLLKLDWDLLAVQETRLGDDAGATKALEKKLSKAKVRLYRGAVGADGVCYVGFLARRGALSVLGSLPVGDPARSLSVIWYVGGQTPIRVTNLYCRNESTAVVADTVSRMVDCAVEQVEGSGGVPALVCGDLNHQLGALEAVATVAASGWTDEGAPWPTCVTSKTVRPRRIDVMLLSPALQARMVASDLRWDTGIANHAYQEVTARAGRLPQVDRWKPAPALPEVLLPALDTEELFARIFPRWRAQWDAIQCGIRLILVFMALPLIQ